MGRNEIEAFSQNRTYTGVSNSNRTAPEIKRLSEKEYEQKKLKELLKLEKQGKLDDNMKPYLKFLTEKYN